MRAIGIPVTLVRGQLHAGDRRPGGGGVAGVRYFVSGFWRELQKFKKFCGLRPQSQGDPYLLAAASRPRAILSSACPGPVRGGGGVVHVASYMLVLHRSRQGGAVCSYLQVCLQRVANLVPLECIVVDTPPQRVANPSTLRARSDRYSPVHAEH